MFDPPSGVQNILTATHHVMSHHVISCNFMSCHVMPHTSTVRWQALRGCGRIASICFCCYFDTHKSRLWRMNKAQHSN